MKLIYILDEKVLNTNQSNHRLGFYLFQVFEMNSKTGIAIYFLWLNTYGIDKGSCKAVLLILSCKYFIVRKMPSYYICYIYSNALKTNFIVEVNSKYTNPYQTPSKGEVRPRDYKTFLCSTQLTTTFILLINV